MIPTTPVLLAPVTRQRHHRRIGGVYAGLDEIEVAAVGRIAAAGSRCLCIDWLQAGAEADPQPSHGLRTDRAEKTARARRDPFQPVAAPQTVAAESSSQK